MKVGFCMNRKYFFLFISVFIMTSQVVIAEYYYCELGQRSLVVCDSMVTIKFDPAFPSPDFGAFAYSVPALDESRMPEEGYRGFYTYWVESGYDIDSLIEDLRSIDVVLYAFPSYLDSYGNLYRLTDLFLVSYSPGVSQSQIDSIQTYYNVRDRGLHLMSDNGSQPTSERFMKACSLLDIHQAFTSYNNPKGNADTERLMRTIKEELIWLREWRDPFELSAEVGRWIETYNESYLHSALGYRTPKQMEETYNLTTRTLLKNAG
jgi:hypothetical protein